LREISWVDEPREAITAARPSAHVVEEITKSQARLRVRRIAGIFVGGLLIALSGGGYGLSRFMVEGRRQAQALYGDVGRGLQELKTLLNFMIFAAQDYASTPLSLESLPTFASLSSPRVVTSLMKLDFSAPKTTEGPFIGFGAIFPPGRERRAVSAIAASAKRIKDELETLWRKNAPLADRDVVELTRRLANHTCMTALSEAADRMERYHKIEDAAMLPFHLFREAGVGIINRQEYVEFVNIAEQLSKRLASLRSSAAVPAQQN
jgi:hypothetical protein